MLWSGYCKYVYRSEAYVACDALVKFRDLPFRCLPPRARYFAVAGIGCMSGVGCMSGRVAGWFGKRRSLQPIHRQERRSAAAGVAGSLPKANYTHIQNVTVASHV